MQQKDSHGARSVDCQVSPMPRFRPDVLWRTVEYEGGKRAGEFALARVASTGDGGPGSNNNRQPDMRDSCARLATCDLAAARLQTR